MKTPVNEAIDALTKQVDVQDTVIGSAEALMTGLADQLRANANSPAAINAIADRITAKSAELAAAVEANTV